jgi:hypothetical protein
MQKKIWYYEKWGGRHASFLLDHLLNENKKICFLNLLTFSAQGRGLAPIFGDVSQRERLSEIKPPLAATRKIARKLFEFFF